MRRNPQTLRRRKAASEAGLNVVSVGPTAAPRSHHWTHHQSFTLRRHVAQLMRLPAVYRASVAHNTPDRLQAYLSTFAAFQRAQFSVDADLLRNMKLAVTAPSEKCGTSQNAFYRQKTRCIETWEVAVSAYGRACRRAGTKNKSKGPRLRRRGTWGGDAQGAIAHKGPEFWVPHGERGT